MGMLALGEPQYRHQKPAQSFGNVIQVWPCCVELGTEILRTDTRPALAMKFTCDHAACTLNLSCSKRHAQHISNVIEV